MTDIQIPDLPAPIVGYKALPVMDGLLRTMWGTVWDPDAPTVAKCGAEKCPDSPCPPDTPRHPYGHGCGLYAYSSIENLGRCSALPPGLDVNFRVLLWGTVYPYEHGYRAQFGKVDAILRPELHVTIATPEILGHYAKLSRVAHRYGVPIEPMGLTFQDMKRLRREGARSRISV